MNVDERIEAVKIQWTREGLVSEELTAYLEGRGTELWARAQAKLDAASRPRDGGYNKVFYTVTFADGMSYSGRLDLKNQKTDPKLAECVRQEVKFLAGVERPAQNIEVRYRALVQDTRFYKAFLDQYAMG